jgi:protein TonB
MSGQGSAERKEQKAGVRQGSGVTHNAANGETRDEERGTKREEQKLARVEEKRGLATEAVSGKQSALNAAISDPAGQVLVYGETVPMGTKGDGVSERNMLVDKGPQDMQAGNGKGKVLNYGNNFDARDFPFIADTINKQFRNKYPDRARRMGWEGKVLISFVIFENGTIHNVKIMNGSGRRDFDEHARDILEKTTFTQKLPYRLQVENWLVEYKLQ